MRPTRVAWRAPRISQIHRKLQDTVIVESAANGPTLDGFENYHYTDLAKKYSVKLIDLDGQEVERVHVFDEKDFRPHAVRMSKLLLDRNNFVISAAKLKTHDLIVATLSLKNIILGAPVKDPGFRWGDGAKPGAKNDKPIAHGNGIRALNFNLFDLSRRLHPHLAVIDGYDGIGLDDATQADLRGYPEVRPQGRRPCSRRGGIDSRRCRSADVMGGANGPQG